MRNGDQESGLWPCKGAWSAQLDLGNWGLSLQTTETNKSILLQSNGSGYVLLSRLERKEALVLVVLHAGVGEIPKTHGDPGELR